jgi:hypothetical protein
MLSRYAVFGQPIAHSLSPRIHAMFAAQCGVPPDYRAIEAGRDTFAYQVSGEYAMLKAAFANGWLDERACVIEALTGIRRAGADAVLTYFALDVAKWLREAR